LNFIKMHGLGNDFVIVDCFREKITADPPELARQVCDRHLGVGADGLVFIWPHAEADFRMQIINSDGSEAEMCGNAIRCMARYAYETGLVSKTELEVETLAGRRHPELIISDGEVKAVKVDMGEPVLDPAQVPVQLGGDRVVNEPLALARQLLQMTCVSMGNPHCLLFVPNVAAVPLTQIGPEVENHPLFPRKTNVEFIQVLNRNEVKMRVWERGAGETLACGTGACATVVGCVLTGRTNQKITVHLTLGSLEVEWAQDNHVYMTGPTTEVFRGTYAPR